jgi:hypothetical protein
MWNEYGEHDSALMFWTLCIAAFGVTVVAIGG